MSGTSCWRYGERYFVCYICHFELQKTHAETYAVTAWLRMVERDSCWRYSEQLRGRKLHVVVLHCCTCVGASSPCSLATFVSLAHLHMLCCMRRIAVLVLVGWVGVGTWPQTLRLSGDLISEFSQLHIWCRAALLLFPCSAGAGGDEAGTLPLLKPCRCCVNIVAFSVSHLCMLYGAA
jgi:hypothetical protein